MLYTMNEDGSDQRQLSQPAVSWNESRPVWSPDGTKIAFVSSRDFPIDNTEIYVMNADGTGEARLTHSPQRDDWPTWSPSGKQLAFSHGSLLKPEIYRMNVDGRGLRLLSLKRPVFETKFLVVPPAVAGARLTVTLGIRTGTGATVTHAHVSCSASIGGKTVPLTAQSFRVSRARCAWTVPRSAHGKWLQLTIGARLGASAVSETVKTLVR
jgi:dipeptidyl aminopeptidase/acylaminoacyl peptidase